MRRSNSRQVIFGVCLLFLILAIAFGVRLHHFYSVYLDYELPFSIDDVESLTIYDSRFSQKKEITRQEDIAEFIDAVNDITVRSMSADVMQSPQAFKRTYLCFLLKDGSQFPCVCTDSGIGGFSDGSVQLSGESSFDLWDYWDRMDYEVQEDVGAELAQIMMEFREKLQQSG